MTVANFPKALGRVLVYEGKKVDDPHDPGGRTAYGVTQVTYDTYRRRQNLPAHDVFDITPDELPHLYKDLYWDRVKGDALPSGLDLVMFDCAVNSGVAAAARWCQTALGITVDGDVGPRTLHAIEDCQDVVQLIAHILDLRMGTLKRLTTWGRYGKGWSARIANLKKIATAWASNDVGPPPVSIAPQEIPAKAPVNDETVIKPPISVVTTQVSTAATTVATTASGVADQIKPLQEYVSWLIYVFVALTVLSIIAGVVVKLMETKAQAARAGALRDQVDEDADEAFAPVELPELTPAPVKEVVETPVSAPVETPAAPVPPPEVVAAPAPQPQPEAQ